LHADPTPAALAPRTPPANATRLASGVAWVTLVAGHGPHPRATDWVLTYGGTSHSEREFYYSPSPRDAARFATFIAFTDMAIGEKRRYWLPDGSVEDIEIVAVVPRDRVNSHPVFPAPSDALVGTHGERHVVIEAAKPGTRIEPADRVMMRVVAIGDDDYVKLAIPIDLDTRAIVATIPHAMWALMSEPMTPAIEAEVAARKRQVEAVLETLGFASAAVEIATIGDDRVAHFARAGITIDADLNVTRAGRRIAQAAGVGHPLAAYWLPARRTLVVASGRAGHEGCEGTDPRSLSAIKLP